MKKLWFTLGIFLLLAVQTAFCQVKVDTAEITSSVPELTSFHSIIYPMWHDAYPEKDIQALKGFVPEIKTKIDAINKAVLPGILHDKKSDWDNQLKELNKSAENYYTASGGNNDEALLNAAEDLHRNYEMMVRVIRPALKEIDAYHQSLYVIFHKLYPSGKYDEILAMADGLITQADAIVKYPKDDRLKRRLGNDLARFDTAAKNLFDSTVRLKESLKTSNVSEKDKAVQEVHSAYQALDSLF